MLDEIQLAFTPDNVKQVLTWGAHPESAPHHHESIAHWCEAFWNKYADIDAPAEIDAVMPILAEVESNWDIHVALNKESASMPAEWFVAWLSQLPE
ncbi:hypothetical protein ACK3Y1_12480 [Aeromonas caviae]|uniref:hypothetical protein n=1 Tax=Aeromonas TaxID=642 RepID=UPI000651319E|nr:hypothetical protein [Aeromonas caviae]